MAARPPLVLQLRRCTLRLKLWRSVAYVTPVVEPEVAELLFGRVIDGHKQPNRGAPHWLLWHMQPATQGEANGNAAMQLPAAQKELESH
jgi:hypothetical protein